MNFAEMMKGEIDRKRKKVETDLKIGSKKTYFKRGDLVRIEKEKYESRMGMAKASAPQDRIKELEDKTQAMLDRLGPDQAKMMPREVVVKKLRERREPILLFGETDQDAFFRLRKLELGCQEQYKILGWTNEIKNAMEQLDDEDIEEVTKSMTEGSNKGEKKYNINLKYEHELVDNDWLIKHKHILKEVSYDDRSSIIIKAFKFWQKCWAEELNSRSTEEKGSHHGRQLSAVWKQTDSYIKPLFDRIERNVCPDDIMKHLSLIVEYCIDRNYIKASDVYLKMAIGNAPWPIGVDHVGIHMRPSRETISMKYVAHVLNDETQRKFIQGLKRLMTTAQRHFPADPSQCVEFGAGVSHVANPDQKENFK